MSKSNTFIEVEDSFLPKFILSSHKELPAGIYSPWYDYDNAQAHFDKIKVNCDNIVNLPSKEYEYVVNQMNYFLKDSTKEKYLDNGFIYKRSVLLHGKPGTGKTVIVNRITHDALKTGAIVLFNPDPCQMEEFFKALDDTNGDRLTVVIFEEFDEILKKPGRESALLSLLDGEVQKKNIIYMATTNYIDQVPLRFQRPGRFSSIVEVDFPSQEAREVYLTAKNVEPNLAKSWAAKTAGFSIDELKETVLVVKCLNESLDTVVSRIVKLKQNGLESESSQVQKEEKLMTEAVQVMNKVFGSPAKLIGKYN